MYLLGFNCILFILIKQTYTIFDRNTDIATLPVSYLSMALNSLTLSSNIKLKSQANFTKVIYSERQTQLIIERMSFNFGIEWNVNDIYCKNRVIATHIAYAIEKMSLR